MSAGSVSMLRFACAARWLAAIAVGLAVLWFAAALMRAQARHTAAQQTHQHVLTVAQKIAELRAAETVATLERRPHAGLLEEIASTLAEAGVTSSALQSVTPEAESPAGTHAGVQYMHQRASVQISELSLADLGRWLHMWQERSNGWTVASIELVPTKPPANLKPHDVPKVRASMTLEAVYIANAPSIVSPNADPAMSPDR